MGGPGQERKVREQSGAGLHHVHQKCRRLADGDDLLAFGTDQGVRSFHGEDVRSDQLMKVVLVVIPELPGLVGMDFG